MSASIFNIIPLLAHMVAHREELQVQTRGRLMNYYDRCC